MQMLNADNGDAVGIRYEVVKNHAQSKLKSVDVYNARVVAGVKSLREVADAMVLEGCKYETAEVLAILEKFAQVTARLLQKGNAVNVGSLVRFRPSIQGKFADEGDSFQRGTHRILVRACIGSALRNIAATASAMRVTPALPMPELLAVYNGATGNENMVSNEATFAVRGKALVYDKDAADEGFFLNLDGQDLRCPVVTIDDTACNVMLMVPHQVAPGNELELTFRTRHTSNGSLAIVGYTTTLTCEAAAAE